MHEMPIFTGIPVPTGKISVFAFFYIGMPTLIVRIVKILCMGCLFSKQDAHIYCENGHQDAYVFVHIGIGMPICTSHPGCVYLGMPIFT